MPIAPRDLQASLLAYFGAEKAESAVFVALGGAALVASALLVRGGGPYRAMAFPLVAIAFIQLGVGGAVWLRTDRQVAALGAQLEAAPAAFRAEETARMEKVMASFRLYKAIEIALLAAGIGLCLAFPRREAIYAAGIGLIVQPAAMLVADLIAEARGRSWLEAVSRLPAG